ncbi:MAG: Gmad2 immunoglobulin-like domain-containing protein [Anaerolineales bacterium]
MKSSRTPSLLLALFFSSLACNLPIGITPTAGAETRAPAATLTREMPTREPTAAVPPLTVEMLKNGTYLLPQAGETVTLVDGRYDRAESMEDLLHVELRDPIAFGDLDGDGAEDAAFLLSENMGGTGFFVSLLAIRNDGGNPVQAASEFIEDRPQINGLTIMGGRIAADLVIHGHQDPMCCPTLPAVATYRLAVNKLVLIRFTTQTPGGEERAITITGPAGGSAVSGSVQVSGAITISPFENTLSYKIFDAADNELAMGPVQVQSEDIGAPGTFNVTISLAGIPAGAMIRLEISDISMADGSLLAMDSVALRVE